ncbi:porin [Paraburkholderia dinghuensis]|uniref:Porin n=1 Tax=Paraburkholderia dinghuensis TaxID=2305225 RepID=A0A3N6MKP9_9BURK|nr:porin [Paraburkholderia dinghuensis]
MASAIFRLQSAFNINNGGFARNESLFNRLAYVGLQNDTYGTLTLGRQFDSVVDYLSPLFRSNTSRNYPCLRACLPICA